MPDIDVDAQQVQPLEEKGALRCSLIPWTVEPSSWYEQKKRLVLHKTKGKRKRFDIKWWVKKEKSLGWVLLCSCGSFYFSRWRWEAKWGEWNPGANWIETVGTCHLWQWFKPHFWLLPSNQIYAKASIFVCTDVAKEDGGYIEFYSIQSL